MSFPETWHYYCFDESVFVYSTAAVARCNSRQQNGDLAAVF